MTLSMMINAGVVLAGIIAAFVGVKVGLRNLKDLFEKYREADDARHKDVIAEITKVSDKQVEIRIEQAVQAERLQNLKENKKECPDISSR